MSEYNEFSGVYALLLTPFKWDRSVDYKTYEEYVQWQSSFRPGHLFANCGSSEATSLTVDERVECASLAVKNANGIPVFATGNIEEGFNNQAEEIKRLEQTGVSGLVFITRGMCDRPAEIYDYLTDLASRTELPIMLYEFPGMNPCHLDAETYGRLAATGRFKGIKDTTCSMPQIEAKIAVQGDSSVCQANVPLLYDSYLKGAKGVMATPTTCGAELFVRMWDEFISGDSEAAKKTHRNIILLDNIIDADFNASAKYLVKLRGVDMNWYTRGNHNLGAARARAIEIWKDWAVDSGILGK